MPIIFSVFGLNKRFANDKGRAPAWLVALTGAIFNAVWLSYDNFFKHIFGDGERTMGEEDEAYPVGVKGNRSDMYKEDVAGTTTLPSSACEQQEKISLEN